MTSVTERTFEAESMVQNVSHGVTVVTQLNYYWTTFFDYWTIFFGGGGGGGTTLSIKSAPD